MENLENAKKLLDEGRYTCVLYKDGTVYTSDKTGVEPMKEFIAQGVDLGGFAAADRVVGMAAARLFVQAGAAEVYGTVMSKPAAELFDKSGIKYSYGELVSNIMNKKGTGLCPMEVRAVRIKNGKLGFGVMRMPLLDENDKASFDYEQINRMTDEFLGAGFDYFDTAYVYHNGQSESMIKKCVTERYPRDCFRLATKLPLWDLHKKEDMERTFNSQLENCGVSYFDNYLLHSINKTNYETVKRLDAFAFGFDLKKRGLVKKFGFSMHDTPELLDEILTAHPDVDFVQLQINYIDWDNQAIASRRCYEVARKHNIPVIVMEPIKGGNLAHALPDEAIKVFKDFAPDSSPSSWAVRFCAGLEGVETVLSGMSDIEQMKDNVGYMREFKPLSQEEQGILENVKQIIGGNTAIGCTGCGYCVEDCPMKIAIPDYFALYNDVKRSKNGFIQGVYYRNISEHRGKASDCIACGACENKCPQKLEIINGLKAVTEMFEKDE